MESLVFSARKIFQCSTFYVLMTFLRLAYPDFTFDPNVYEVTVFDNFDMEYTLEGDNTKKTLRLFDTAGQDDFKHMRNVAYKNVDVLILAFSIVDRTSFKAVTEGDDSWISEQKKYMRNAKVSIKLLING